LYIDFNLYNSANSLSKLEFSSNFKSNTTFYDHTLKFFKNHTRKDILSKSNFFNLNTGFNKVILLNKVISTDKSINRYYKLLYKFFSKTPYNLTTKQKTQKFLTYLLLYFLLTHDLYFFLKKMVNFLQNTSRRFQFKIVRSFVLLNQSHNKLLFDYFRVSGLYFRVSGKFGGVGGAKKMKKKIV